MLWGLSARLMGIIGALLLYGGGIWHIHSIYDEVKADRVLRKQIEATEAAQGEAIKIDGEARKKQGELLKKINDIKEAWNEERLSKKIADCKLPDDAVRMLRAADAVARNTTYGAD